MSRRNQIPLLLLAVLGLLTAGFAALAVSAAPNEAEVTVQSGTAQTFGASSFTLDLTSSVSSGQGTGTISQVRQITYTSPTHMVVYRVSPTRQLLGTLGAKAIATVLAGYAAVTAGTTPWVHRGAHFTRTESLVAFSARVSHAKSAQGEVFETAVVRNGFLVYVNLHVIVPNQTTAGGQQAAGGVVGEIFQMVKINGSTVPASAS